VNEGRAEQVGQDRGDVVGLHVLLLHQAVAHPAGEHRAEGVHVEGIAELGGLGGAEGHAREAHLGMLEAPGPQGFGQCRLAGAVGPQARPWPPDRLGRQHRRDGAGRGLGHERRQHPLQADDVGLEHLAPVVGAGLDQRT